MQDHISVDGLWIVSCVGTKHWLVGSKELASKMWLDGWVEVNQANKGEGEAEGITKGENSMCQGTAPLKRRKLSITCKSFRLSQAQGAEASDRKSEKLTLQGTQMITWGHTRIQMLVPACSVTSFIFDSYNPMDYSPPGSSLHGILLARILERVAISPSRGFPKPKDWICVLCVSCFAGRFFTHWATFEALRWW